MYLVSVTLTNLKKKKKKHNITKLALKSVTLPSPRFLFRNHFEDFGIKEKGENDPFSKDLAIPTK